MSKSCWQLRAGNFKRYKAMPTGDTEQRSHKTLGIMLNLSNSVNPCFSAGSRLSSIRWEAYWKYPPANNQKPIIRTIGPCPKKSSATPVMINANAMTSR